MPKKNRWCPGCKRWKHIHSRGVCVTCYKKELAGERGVLKGDSVKVEFMKLDADGAEVGKESYVGYVTKVKKDKTLDIDYADGDKEEGVCVGEVTLSANFGRPQQAAAVRAVGGTYVPPAATRASATSSAVRPVALVVLYASADMMGCQFEGDDRYVGVLALEFESRFEDAYVQNHSNSHFHVCNILELSHSELDSLLADNGCTPATFNEMLVLVSPDCKRGSPARGESPDEEYYDHVMRDMKDKIDHLSKSYNVKAAFEFLAKSFVSDALSMYFGDTIVHTTLVEHAFEARDRTFSMLRFSKKGALEAAIEAREGKVEAKTLADVMVGTGLQLEREMRLFSKTWTKKSMRAGNFEAGKGIDPYNPASKVGTITRMGLAALYPDGREVDVPVPALLAIRNVGGDVDFTLDSCYYDHAPRSNVHGRCASNARLLIGNGVSAIVAAAIKDLHAASCVRFDHMATAAPTKKLRVGSLVEGNFPGLGGRFRGAVTAMADFPAADDRKAVVVTWANGEISGYTLDKANKLRVNPE